MVLQVKPEAPERLPSTLHQQQYQLDLPSTLHQQQHQLDSSCQNCGSRCNGHPALVSCRREIDGVEHGSRSRETEGDLPFYFSQDSPHWQNVHLPHLMRAHRSDVVIPCQRSTSSIVGSRQTGLVMSHQCPSVSMVGSRQTGLVHSRHQCPSLASRQQSRQTELEEVGLELRTIGDRCTRPRPNPTMDIGGERGESADEQLETNRELPGGVVALHDRDILAHENAGRELRRLADEICGENWPWVVGDLDPEDTCCILAREIGRELGSDIADKNEMNRELQRVEVDKEIGRELRRIADAICQGPWLEVLEDPGDSGCSKMDSHRKRKNS